MNPTESIKKQLDANKPFVRLRSDHFCELAETVKPNSESKDDAERSMALTLGRYKGKHPDVLHVNAKVASRLLAGQKVKIDSPSKDAKEPAK